MYNKLYLNISALYWLFFVQSVFASLECPSVKYGSSQYGPVNYYSSSSHVLGGVGVGRKDESKVTLVTNYHFNNNVLNLKSGSTGTHIWGDLDYTLRAIPNNPSALDTASRLEVKRSIFKNFAKKQGPLPYSVDCYFQRAFNVFGSKQSEIWMLWGSHKHRQGKYVEALEKYKKATELKLDSAEFHYNMGLTYYKLKEYDKAKIHAEVAYRKGYKLPGLKRLLNKISDSEVNGKGD